MRILCGEKLIISYDDLYVPSSSLKEKFRWDEPGHTLFDDALREHHDKLIGAKIIETACKGKNLYLTLSCDLALEVLEDTVQTGIELYRIFDANLDDSHFVVET